MKLEYIIVVIGFMIVLGACDSLLEEEPKDFISSVNFYETADDAEAALDAVYAGLNQGSFYEIWFWALITGSADYADSRGSQAPISQYQGLDAVNQDRAHNSYSDIYNGINRANAVLGRVPEIEMDEGQKAQILAEARMLRAFYYSNLAKYWGGVPIRTTETVGLDEIAAPRASEEEVWDLVISDLNQAIPELPDVAPSGKATSWAAKMILAEAHIANENWGEARSIADDVVMNGPFSLVEVNEPDDFLEEIYAHDVYGHSEEIWTINFSSSNANGFVNWIQRPPPFNVFGPSGVWAKLPVMTSWVGEWDEDDLRQQYNLYTSVVIDGEVTPLPEASPVLFKKYQDPDSDSGSRNQAQLFRYPEALLFYAEAANEVEGGPTDLALERLNMVRRRGYGYDPHSSSPVDFPQGMSQAEFRDTVLLERAKEFILEGKRWHDLLRTGTAKEVIEATGKNFREPVSYRFPLPPEEIQNNPDMGPDDQNPGY